MDEGIRTRGVQIDNSQTGVAVLVRLNLKNGVGDGIRTRDVQIHSLALYQLSYTHHNCGARRQVALIPL